MAVHVVAGSSDGARASTRRVGLKMFGGSRRRWLGSLRVGAWARGGGVWKSPLAGPVWMRSIFQSIPWYYTIL